MKYFLKKTNNKYGQYLQIYKSEYHIDKKGSRNSCYQSIGYVEKLISPDMPDPVAYYTEVVKKMNDNVRTDEAAKIGDDSASKFIGHFLTNGMFDTLRVAKDLHTMTKDTKPSRVDVESFFKNMIACQILSPGSKYKSFDKIIPNLFDGGNFTYDQILDMTNYIGQDYAKYVELFNHHIERQFDRNINDLYFDCTNYYFEIDQAFEDKQKGPSKENRRDPIIGQALLLDSDCIPLGMMMYPGNESEKPYIRKVINDMKNRFNVTNRIVQVADKGLNCARNIYEAIQNGDGYIFSKSIHGTGISKTEKAWVIRNEEGKDKWVDVKDNKGKLIYRYKEKCGVVKYNCTLEDNGEKVKFEAEEKWIASYNPKLAAKKLKEIDKQIDKALNLIRIKDYVRDSYGDSAKYVTFSSKDKDDNDVDIIASINNQKIQEDKALAGYNLIVTSEFNRDAESIYDTYHNLSRIENSFRIQKTYLEARPVYLQKKESIYGHFTICYLALTLLRLLEKYTFDNEISAEELVDFMREFKVTKTMDQTFVNNAMNNQTFRYIQNKLGLSKMDNLYLTQKDIKNFSI